MIPCYKSVKLVIDKLAALVLLVLLFPLLLVLVALVYWDQKSIFFKQQRPGLLEEPFLLLKFKTMKDGVKRDSQRVTMLGNWLRKYSLDELPQLWNVLKGEMSLIGPRPYLLEYLDLYSDVHKKRHWVLPGLTGWAQVNGGNELCWEKKLDLDAFYVDHLNFWLDLKIILKTITLMVKGKRKDLPDSKFMGYTENIG
ncbi:Sugar transferase involved in LPS biosynthesis (colanic, teichoic acid) [Reichenbachiella faecimaris]|uniref:Sugar transferase involved in LPS biosynthesis (Colanic, teichoic acid) n=1 Tax=Reichenbachiella faecimaris TaxID=692418 RepID=A0A1W2GN52_REIFA|nr:sugar transferase [Reichenbachiella faecimaris]SMD38085.1 Sugar transferase involved in LPS biosynthesis (colanic, teichoic acid) [Reichenbachiella faecimaris]